MASTRVEVPLSTDQEELRKPLTISELGLLSILVKAVEDVAWVDVEGEAEEDMDSSGGDDEALAMEDEAGDAWTPATARALELSDGTALALSKTLSFVAVTAPCTGVVEDEAESEVDDGEGAELMLPDSAVTDSVTGSGGGEGGEEVDGSGSGSEAGPDEGSACVDEVVG